MVNEKIQVEKTDAVEKILGTSLGVKGKPLTPCLGDGTSPVPMGGASLPLPSVHGISPRVSPPPMGVASPPSPSLGLDVELLPHSLGHHSDVMIMKKEKPISQSLLQQFQNLYKQELEDYNFRRQSWQHPKQ